MIRNYSSSINNDLTIIINTLNQNGKKVDRTISLATSLKIDIYWSLLRRESIVILKDLNLFYDSFAFDISYQKKSYIHQFYNYEIFDAIGYIKLEFNYQVKEGQRQLEGNLTSFNVDDKAQELKNNLDNSYFDNIMNSKRNLITDFSLLRNNILNEFADFKILLENEPTIYNVEGFEKKEVI